MKFRLALVQMLVEGGRKQANVRRAIARIDEAASAGADIVLLPEAMTLGWTHPCSIGEADEVPGGCAYDELAEAARRNGIYVCSGLIERAGETIYNTAVLLDPEGELILHHRKINELDIAHGLYALGDRMAVAPTRFGTIGVMICADAFANDLVLSRSLCHMGADVILSPCSWAVDADHDNVREPYGGLWRDSYRPVAEEFSVWIAGASNVGPIAAGPWKGKKCIGCSLVIDAEGKVAGEGPYGVDAETILYVDVDPVERPARGDGWAERVRESVEAESVEASASVNIHGRKQ